MTTTGAAVQLYQEIEQIRLSLGIPTYHMCNILNISTADYERFQHGQFTLSTYSLIMFINETGRPLMSIAQ
ncbi:MAG: hypothetical protein K2L25_03885 [Alphaproteobacteria bacterium]|nr:hypothetical protein [Alphaproteobacteria bacterium]